MAGLLDFMNTPEGVGLLSAVAGGLAGARRGTPLNNIGRGLVSGVTGYQATQDQARQEKEGALAQQYRQMQMEQIQRQMAEQKKKDEFMAGLPAMLNPKPAGYSVGGEQFPTSAGAQAASFLNAAQTPMQDGQVPQAQLVQEQPGQVDQAALQQYLMQPGSPYADKLIEAKFLPKAPIKLAAGESLVDPTNYNSLYTAPKDLSPTGDFATFTLLKQQGHIPADTDYTAWHRGNARSGASNIVNNLSQGTEKKYGEKFAEAAAGQDLSVYETAQKAPELASRSNRIKQVISTGKVITGFGAEPRLALGKALGLVGASDAETIANTEALSADLSKNTLDAIKASGLGSGNGFSNADRDFLEKAAGGKITLEAATLSRLADLSHRAATLSADKWNKRSKMIPKSAMDGTGITSDPISVPPLYGQTQVNNGQVSKSKSGRTIIYRNGQWEYQ